MRAEEGSCCCCVTMSFGGRMAMTPGPEVYEDQFQWPSFNRQVFQEVPTYWDEFLRKTREGVNVRTYHTG